MTFWFLITRFLITLDILLRIAHLGNPAIRTRAQQMFFMQHRTSNSPEAKLTRLSTLADQIRAQGLQHPLTDRLYTAQTVDVGQQPLFAVKLQHRYRFGPVDF